jgi:hypothetical protein
MIEALLPHDGKLDKSHQWVNVEKAVKSVLEAYNIDYHEWRARSKSQFSEPSENQPLKELIRKFEEEQVSFDFRDPNVPTLVLRIACVRVCHYGKNGKVELQEMGSFIPMIGRTIVGHFSGISKTCARDEPSIITAWRAVKENLGQTQPLFRNERTLELIRAKGRLEQTKLVPSRRWPGLFAVAEKQNFIMMVSKVLFSDEYYCNVLDGDKKRLYKVKKFSWRKPEYSS